MTLALRNELVCQHLELVRNIALSQPKPSWIDIDDLVQAGRVGLIQAADRYDPANPEFRYWAWPRIQGAMKDWLRKQSYSHAGDVAEMVDQSPSPYAQIVHRQNEKRLKVAVVELRPRDRQLVDGLYRDGLTQKEVAVEMGVNQSRISRGHLRVLKVIRLKVA